MGYGQKIEKSGKLETHTVGPGIWVETLKNVKNDNCTLQDLDFGEKSKKLGK